jgi:hypothetical protein
MIASLSDIPVTQFPPIVLYHDERQAKCVSMLVGVLILVFQCCLVIFLCDTAGRVLEVPDLSQERGGMVQEVYLHTSSQCCHCCAHSDVTFSRLSISPPRSHTSTRLLLYASTHGCNNGPVNGDQHHGCCANSASVLEPHVHTTTQTCIFQEVSYCLHRVHIGIVAWFPS